MTKSDYILKYRKMRNKLVLAAGEIFDVQHELLQSKNIPASNMAGKLYDGCHELTDLLKWAETMAEELSTLANE